VVGIQAPAAQPTTPRCGTAITAMKPVNSFTVSPPNAMKPVNWRHQTASHKAECGSRAATRDGSPVKHRADVSGVQKYREARCRPVFALVVVYTFRKFHKFLLQAVND
jgi:hypothetical protein